MAVEGVAKYGAGAYGPSGSKINTNFPFTVKTELVATANTANFWKLRTTLTQSGREIKLDADCRSDSYTMDYDLGGGVMDVAFSTWGNLSGADITFPLSDTCSAPASCSGTTGRFADVTILTVGSNEDPPLPPPAEYQPWDVTIDGGLQTTYLKGIPDRPLTTSGSSATIGHNNRAFVLSVDDDSSVLNTLRQDLYGGKLSWTMDVSNVQCRCAAGLFLAELQDGLCDFNPIAIGTEPSCKSVDLIQANINGFTTRFGDLCTWNSELCGSTAYGEGSSYQIDSTRPYDVSIAFYRSFDRSALTRIVGTLEQDLDVVEFELAEAGELATIADALESGMSLAINNQMIEATDITNVGCYVSCSDATAVFSNLSWTTDIAVEDEIIPEPVTPPEEEETLPEPEPTPPEPEPTPPEPEPQPEPATFEAFTASSDATSQTSFFAKGQDDRTLTTSGSDITIGQDNRAFVYTVEDDSTVANAYRHGLYGGSLSFTVDASAVGCGCYGGVALANLDDATCTFADIESGACQLTELFETNINGFESYLDETCGVESDQIENGDGYGPGSAYYIDSTLPYSVDVQFFKEYDSSALTRVVSVLSQSNKTITITKNCPTALAAFTTLLQNNNVALAITNKPLADPSIVSSVTCSETCTSSSLTVGSLSWSSNDAVEDEPAPEPEPEPQPEPQPELVTLGVAPRTDMGACADDPICVECREQAYDNDLDTIVSYTCTIAGGVHTYSNKCSTKRNPSFCNWGDQPCMWSYPKSEGSKSSNGACRDLPDPFNSELDSVNWKWQNKARSASNGLCGVYGCSGTCHRSWPISDPLRNKSIYSMVRCLP